jgi:hypothetical protein
MAADCYPHMQLQCPLFRASLTCDPMLTPVSPSTALTVITLAHSFPGCEDPWACLVLVLKLPLES